jgi:hypothetical protein
MIQLGAHGVTVPFDASQLPALRLQFARDDYVRLPALLEPALLDKLLAGIDHEQFLPRVHPGVGVETWLPNDCTTARALNFLSNSQTLFDASAQITDCSGIGSFRGRVFRMASADGSYDSWHDDVAPDRLFAMSINLSSCRFRGGALEILNQQTGVASSIDNPRAGDAILFRITPGLVHRITPVEGPSRRTAYAGWFCSSLDPVRSLGAAARND